MENKTKKKCSKCQDFNCLSKYYKGKRGLQAYCKECRHKTYIENRDKILEHIKNEYYPKNRDRILEEYLLYTESKKDI